MKEPKFERRHYRAVADVLRSVLGRPEFHGYGANERPMQWTAIKTEMGRMFKADNPRFNAGKFEEACEP